MKKAGLLFATVIMTVILFAFSASALSETGQCGVNVYWNYDSSTGEVVISGSGPMYEYLGYTPFDFYSDIKKVIVKEGVTSIGNYSFGRCESLKSVTIPDSVTRIGHGAFEYCHSLTSATIPDSVIDLGNMAFYNCHNLTNVIIGKGLTSISEDAFSYCENLKSVTIGNNVTSIGDGAFSYCKKLTSISIGKNVTSIGNGAFEWCESLKSIVIPNSVTSMGESVFWACKSLTNVTIGKSVTSISAYMFYYCTSLSNIVIPDSVISVDAWAFTNCTSLSSVVIPCSVKDIGYSAFDSCYNLNKVYYSGTEKQWKLISIDNEWNDPLITATIHYNSNGVVQEDKKYVISGRSFTKNLDYFTFYTNSSSYNTELANMAAALSKDVYSRKKIIADYYALGFENVNVLVGDYDGAFNPLNCGFALGLKKSEYSDETICLITVRGSSNISDWVGNISMLTLLDGKHTGFSKPAERIYNVAKDLAKEKGFTGKIKYVITGHSRGAAVANLLSVKLMENGVSSADVYNYNFACPDVAALISFKNYNNIFNICNRLDIVPYVPGDIASIIAVPGISWDKYGQTYWFTAYNSDRSPVVPEHDMGLYLKQLDLKKLPSEWKQSVEDEIHDKLAELNGWVAKIFCPVDVVITDSQGNRIASVIGDKVNYYNSKFGDVIIFTDGDRKAVYIKGDKEFKVNLTGTDEGTMMYSLEKCNPVTEETFETKTFTDVELKKGKEMQSSVSEKQKTEDVKLFVTEKLDGKEINSYEIAEDGDEKEINHVYKVTSHSPATYTKFEKTVYTCSCGDSYIVTGKSLRKLKKPSSFKTKAVTLAAKNKSTLAISWKKVTGAEKYEVEQYVGKKWKRIKTVSGTSLKVSKLTAGKSYKFRVRALAGKNKSAYSSIYTAKAVPLKIRLSSVKAGETKCTVYWKKATGITGYEIQYSTSKKFTKKTTKTVTVKKAKMNKAVISRLKNNGVYFVRIRAYKTVGSKKIYGAYSSTYTVKPTPVKVKLSGVKAGKNQFIVSWKTVSSAEGYEVVYSTSAKFTSKTTEKVIVKKAKTEKTTVRKLKKGKMYFVKVRAYKTAGGEKIYGSYSDVKSVKVK